MTPALRRRGLVAVILAACLAVAAPGIGQIDPNVPTTIPDDELGDSLGILDTVLTDLLEPGTPPMLDLGTRLWRGLSLLLIVWTGLRIAFSGTGWKAWDIVELLFTLWVPWGMLQFYDTPFTLGGVTAPPFPLIIPRGADAIAIRFQADIPVTMLQTLAELGEKISLQIETAWQSGSVLTLVTSGYALVASTLQTSVVLLLLFVCLLLIYAIGMAQVIFAKIAIALLIFLGPIFIAFYVFSPLQFLFWGWLKSLFTYSLYSIIAAAFLRLWCGLAAGYASTMINAQVPTFTEFTSMMSWTISILPLSVAAILSTMKIGEIAAMIVGAGGGGSTGFSGVASTLIMMKSGGAGKVAGVAAKAR